MSLWFDISNISTYKGGVVGIIRAELELAYNFAAIDQNIRFCRADLEGENIVEVSRDSLGWLLSEEFSPVEGFLKKNKVTPVIDNSPQSAFIKSFRQSMGRAEHLKKGADVGISILPKPIATLTYPVAKFSFKLMMYLRNMRRRIKHENNSTTSSKTNTPTTYQSSNPVSHPFKTGDILFAAGWMDNGKEQLYTKIKRKLEDKLYLSYLIYDTILINPQTKHIYHKGAEPVFQNYFDWISSNCDLIVYGGETAKIDSQAIQKQRHLNVPEGHPIRFGDTPNTKLTILDESSVLNYFKTLGIQTDQYLLCVGSVEPRKNHDILYKAYREILDNPNNYPEIATKKLPKLVIAGGGTESSLTHTFKNDPKVSPYVVFVRPSDAQLDALYKHCSFTLMPTLYEGWNLTLPESLSYGKFCISSDVAPMKEVGRNLIDYADPWDPLAWAKLIVHYNSTPSDLALKEKIIKNQWQNFSWQDCAQSIYKKLSSFDFLSSSKPNYSDLWFDLTLIQSWRGPIQGIPRAQLSLAWELYNTTHPTVRFFTCSIAENKGQFVEVSPNNLPWLHMKRNKFADFYSTSQMGPSVLNSDKSQHAITVAEISIKNKLKIATLHWLSVFPEKWMLSFYKLYKGSKIEKNIETFNDEIEYASETKNSIANRHSLIQTLIHPFSANDIVISAGLDWSSSYLQALHQLKKTIPLSCCNFMYDFAPLLEPQLFEKHRFHLYQSIYYWTCRSSDIIFFGGKTALTDGEYFQEKYGLPKPAMHPLKLGSAFENLNVKSSDDFILSKIEILQDREFLLSVGTIQPRKNHEVLYRCLVKWLDETPKELRHTIPVFVFAGNQGWLTESLVDIMRRDVRVSDHLLVFSPTDDELSALYRKCQFTLLPSFYEGWSLTIPESLAYGKFCIAADTPPLKEVGREFIDYVNPRDVNGWLSAIKYYTHNKDSLKKKELLIKEGANFYSWEECAKEMLMQIKNEQSKRGNTP